MSIIKDSGWELADLVASNCIYCLLNCSKVQHYPFHVILKTCFDRNVSFPCVLTIMSVSQFRAVCRSMPSTSCASLFDFHY
ncbi:hypothetical protein FKM82_010775 [Ascaphus truei]